MRRRRSAGHLSNSLQRSRGSALIWMNSVSKRRDALKVRSMLPGAPKSELLLCRRRKLVSRRRTVTPSRLLASTLIAVANGSACSRNSWSVSASATDQQAPVPVSTFHPHHSRQPAAEPEPEPVQRNARHVQTL